MEDFSVDTQQDSCNKTQYQNGFQETSQSPKSNTMVLMKTNSAVILEKKKSKSCSQIVSELIEVNTENAGKEIGTFILLGVILLVFIISVTGFFVMWFTEYYNNVLLSKIVLIENTEMAENWINPGPQYDTLLKVHIFNYTNIDRYLAGEDDKIKVEDIGPLTYREHTTKVNLTFNSNYTVTFNDKRSYKFLPEKSSCNEHDEFILPNVPLLTAALRVDSMHILKKIAAVQVINAYKEEVFKKFTAHSYLWGYRDRIVSLDFGTGSSHFGLLMNRNGTSIDSLQINTGEDNIEKFGIITQFNGMESLNFWNDSHCNEINGTDASMFPPHLLTKREHLDVFLQVLCRKISLVFEKEVDLFENVKVFRYRTPLNIFARPEHNPENKCYCKNTQRCLPSGVINATKCYNGAPIYPSFPHFFTADPIVYKDFEGIRPNAESHQTYADIHPRFAFPVNGASRIQINIEVHKSILIKNKVKRIEEGTFLPLIWIEITSSDYTDDIIDKLYVSTFGLDAIQNALKYGTLLACITTFTLIVASFSNLSRRREKQSKIANNIDASNAIQMS